MTDETTRRDFMRMGTVALGGALIGAQTASAQKIETGTDDIRAAPVLVGPDDARPDPGSEFFENKELYGYVYQPTDQPLKYVITSEMDSWGTLSASGLWADSDNDNLAELPNHDGINVDDARVGRAEVGWVGLDSWEDESGVESVTGGGQVTVSFNNVYRVGSAQIGTDETAGEASWFDWDRNADGNIVGMTISYNVGTINPSDARWYFAGNQTEASYN